MPSLPPSHHCCWRHRTAIPTRGDLQFRLTEETNEEGKEHSSKTRTKIAIVLRSRRRETIDDFIAEAYDWYLGQLKKLQNSSRYLYEMQFPSGGSSSLSSGGEDGGGGGGGPKERNYKRYKLSDDKTFGAAALFGPEGG